MRVLSPVVQIAALPVLCVGQQFTLRHPVTPRIPISRTDQWRHFDPFLFDALAQIVSDGQRHVGVLEAANLLPGAIFHAQMIPTGGPIMQRRQARLEWFQAVQRTVEYANLVFVGPDNGLEPAGFSHGLSRAGRSITLDELWALARPGRSLIVYHHHTRRKGGHHGEIDYCIDRLRECGFVTVDALRARPYSPRVFFILDAPADVRQRAEQIAVDWQGWITWQPDPRKATGPRLGQTLDRGPLSAVPERPQEPFVIARLRAGATTQIGYVNRNRQEVI